MGGLGADTITAGNGENRIFGDSGTVTFIHNVIRTAVSTIPETGSDDIITGGIDVDIVIGGAGNDTIDAGLSAVRDVVLGDNGNAVFDEFEVLTEMRTIAPSIGGDDDILVGDGDDFVIGGIGSDYINVNREDGSYLGTDSGKDIIIGDNGSATFDIVLSTQIIRILQTSDPEDSSGDVIYTADGDDIVLGGGGADTIDTGSGNYNDMVIGDNGQILFDASGNILSITTTVPSMGDNDDILTGDGNDIVLGGYGSDVIGAYRATGTAVYADNGSNIVISDNGYIDFIGTDSDPSDIDTIATTDPSIGDVDIIVTGTGNDIILSGTEDDTVHAGDGNNIIISDNGRIISAGQGTPQFGGLAITVGTIETTDFSIGGNDVVTSGAGDDIIFGGHESDTLDAGNGNNIVLGDDGKIVYDSDSNSSDIDLITTMSATLNGGVDTIITGTGDDYVIGGRYGDTVTAGSGDNLVIGDSGRITAATSDAVQQIPGIPMAIARITTIEPADGGVDTIVTGSGEDIVLGGYAQDTINTNAANDIVLGDNGFVDYVVVDGDTSDIDQISSTDPTIGENDIINTGSENDIVIAGKLDDTVYAGQGNDMVFGDHGQLLSTTTGGIDLDALPLNMVVDPFTFTSIDTQNTHDGGADSIYAEEGDDIVIGGQDNDLIYGGSGDDDLIGGHNVADGQDGSDSIDGGAGNDMIAGDNASVLRNNTISSPRMRVISGGVIYDNQDNPQITVAHQNNPDGGTEREVTLFNISDNTSADMYGDEIIAGGADDDMIFGQKGDELIQGDGSIDETVSAQRDVNGALILDPSIDAVTDGDDYIEGNSGNDVIFGNLGQDDIIGGNSTIFTSLLYEDRDDGNDIIFGGSGTEIDRNDLGQTGDNSHSRDSDVIAGDNANIYRLVGTMGIDSGAYLTFNYDNYSGSLRIIPRAVELVDYTPGGLDYLPTAEQAANDIGGNDEIHGEASDDFIYGMGGSDILFGEGQNDDMIGGYGNDWISSGTGEDGVLGDDGRIYTSRNSTVGEPLYGIAGFETNDLDTLVSTPGQIYEWTINVSGQLKRTVNLTPFKLGNPEDLDYAHETFDSQYADDIIYGGWGDDSIHSGDGDDAVSGAEALLEFYNNVIPYQGNVLRFGEERAGEFAAYDEYDPWRKVFVDENGVFTDEANGENFLLNFDAQDGQADNTYGIAKISDGNDRIFGDLGNDWLVGGSGRDHLYGGYGADLLNVDDDHDTNSGANDEPDTDPTYEDYAYGGAGRDVLIANTGGDRLIDWVGAFNSYIVPFGPFGHFAISRSPAPWIREFLYMLSTNDGVDPTRATDTGSDPARNGEPEGELGVVMQKDRDWHDQTGAPDDPQPGNIPGGSRDVLRSATFNSGEMAMEAFAPDTGSWEIQDGKLRVEANSLGADAASVFHVEEALPMYFELYAEVMSDKPIGGWKANAYLIFDYYGPEDFKFAGIDISHDKMQMGHRDATGWIVDVQIPVQVKPNIKYDILVAINGLTATMLVDGTDLFSHVFEPRVIDGYAYTLNTGMVGMGSDNAQGVFDNVIVQVLPPDYTFEDTEDFSDGSADLYVPESIGGVWTVENEAMTSVIDSGSNKTIKLIDLGTVLNINSVLEFGATISTDGCAGIVFDYYNDSDFKFVAIDSSADKIYIGHYNAKGGWQIDDVKISTINSGQSYDLMTYLKGSTISIELDGQAVSGYVYNAVLVDGRFGLLTSSGLQTVFDDVILKTNDDAFLAESENCNAAIIAQEPVGEDQALTLDQLDPIVVEAKANWIEYLGTDIQPILDSITFEIVDLEDEGLGIAECVSIKIDTTAAGWGWYVDPTPELNNEFNRKGTGAMQATPNSDAYGRFDLLTIVTHEIGHVLGYTDTEGEGLMDGVMVTGMRYEPNADLGEPGDSGNPIAIPNAHYDSATTETETAVTIDVLANDTDGNGDILTI